MMLSVPPQCPAADMRSALTVSSLLPCGMQVFAVQDFNAKEMESSLVSIGNTDSLNSGQSVLISYDSTDELDTAIIDVGHVIQPGCELPVGPAAVNCTQRVSCIEGFLQTAASSVMIPTADRKGELSVPCLAQELERTIAELEQKFGSSFGCEFDEDVPYPSPRSSCDEDYEELPWMDCSSALGAYSTYHSDCQTNSSETSIWQTCQHAAPPNIAIPSSNQEGDAKPVCSGPSDQTCTTSMPTSSLPTPVSALLPAKSPTAPASQYSLRTERKRKRPYSPHDTDDSADGMLDTFPEHKPGTTAAVSGSQSPSGKAVHDAGKKGKDWSTSPLAISSKLPKPGRQSSLRLTMPGRRMSAKYAGRLTLQKRAGRSLSWEEGTEGAVQDEKAWESNGDTDEGIEVAVVCDVPSPVKSEPADVPLQQTQTRKQKSAGPSSPVNGLVCIQCGAQSTPVWRAGPHGPKTLCNACGVRFMKMSKKK